MSCIIIFIEILPIFNNLNLELSKTPSNTYNSHFGLVLFFIIVTLSMLTLFLQLTIDVYLSFKTRKVFFFHSRFSSSEFDYFFNKLIA